MLLVSLIVLQYTLSSEEPFSISAFCLFVGYFGASLSLDLENPVRSLFLLYCFYGALCGFGVGLGYNCTLSTLLCWFPDKIGLASGIMMMSIGSGALAFVGLINNLIDAYGIVVTFRVIAIAKALTLLLSSLVIKMPNKETADKLESLVNKNASSTENAAEKSPGDYLPAQMLKTSIFWLFSIRLILVASAGLLVLNSAAQIATSFGSCATIGLIISLFNGCGGILFGLLFDRYGRAASFTLNSGILTLAGIFLFLASITGHTFLIFIGIPLVGMSYGGSASITSATVRVFWGSKYYSANFGVVNCCLIPASILGPILSSALQGKSGGSYVSTFVMLTLFGIASLIFTFLLRMATRNHHAGE